MSENQIRLERTKGFTVLQNELIRDRRLSLKTKGLFAVLASLPPGWNYSVRGLCRLADVGRDSVYTALKELEAAGYLDRVQTREGGKFASCTYVVHDVSADPQQDCVSPCTDFPYTVQPCTVSPYTGNPPQVNKDLSKEGSIYNNNSIATEEGSTEEESTDAKKDTCAKSASRAKKSMPTWKPERFEGLWRFYPRHEDRKLAVREWDKLRPDDVLIDEIARALVRQKESDDWLQGIGIPYLCRYLSHERWKDERPRAPEASGGWADDREVV